MQSSIVHIVDDDASFQKAIVRLLRATGYEVRCYANAGDFLLASRDETPGCILLDVNMPGPDGLELQKALAKAPHPLPIIFLSGQADVPTSVRAMKAGAVDFLTKPVKREALLGAIRHALARDATERSKRGELEKLRARYLTLSPRECEVFEKVVSGKMNKEIAGELNVSERTVKADRALVMSKMRATSLAELVQIAERLRKGASASRQG